MNRIIVLFFILFLYVHSFVVGQEFHVGFRGGMTFSNPQQIYRDYDLHLGFNVDMFFDIDFTNWFTLQPGLSCNQIGVQYKSERSVGYVNSSFHQQLVTHYVARGYYLSLPLVIAFRIPLGEYVKLEFQGGGYGSVGVGGKAFITQELMEFENSFRSYYEEFDEKYSFFGSKRYQYNRMDAGWTAAFYLHIRKFQIGTKYMNGLINMSNIDLVEMTNKVYTVNIGVTF